MEFNFEFRSINGYNIMDNCHYGYGLRSAFGTTFSHDKTITHTTMTNLNCFFFFSFWNSLRRQSKRFADCRLLLRWLLPRNFSSIFVAVIFLLVCFPFSFSFCHLHGNWVNFKTATSSHSHLHLNIWMLRDVCPQLELFSIKKKWLRCCQWLKMETETWISICQRVWPSLGPSLADYLQCVSVYLYSEKKCMSNTKNYSTFTYSN